MAPTRTTERPRAEKREFRIRARRLQVRVNNLRHFLSVSATLHTTLVLEPRTDLTPETPSIYQNTCM